MVTMGRLTPTQRSRIKAAFERGEERAKVRAAFGLSRAQTSYYARKYGEDAETQPTEAGADAVQASRIRYPTRETQEEARDLLDMSDEPDDLTTDTEPDVCGACGSILKDRWPFCPFCGVALDWSGVF